MDTAEVKVNLEEIKKEMQAGFINANNSEGEKVQVVNADSVKPILDISQDTIKYVYKIKKRFQLAFHSKNVPSHIKPKLSHLAKVEDREAEVIKRVVDKYGSDNLPPEVIGFIQKYIDTPIWPWVEMELELNDMMKTNIQVIVNQHKGKEEGE